MENQEEKNPQPVKRPEEANTGEESHSEQHADKKEPKATGQAPEIETPRVPDADAEGHP